MLLSPRAALTIGDLFGSVEGHGWSDSAPWA